MKSVVVDCSNNTVKMIEVSNDEIKNFKKKQEKQNINYQKPYISQDKIQLAKFILDVNDRLNKIEKHLEEEK